MFFQFLFYFTVWLYEIMTSKEQGDNGPTAPMRTSSLETFWFPCFLISFLKKIQVNRLNSFVKTSTFHFNDIYILIKKKNKVIMLVVAVVVDLLEKFHCGILWLN